MRLNIRELNFNGVVNGRIHGLDIIIIIINDADSRTHILRDDLSAPRRMMYSNRQNARTLRGRTALLF